MKQFLLKSVLMMGLLFATAFFAKAQKFGDNLGNHTATKDLQMAGKSIFNAEGIAIGTATISNGSVALQIGSANKAILISSVTANTDIATPVNGMIVYNNTDNKFYLYQNGAWVTFALSLKASTDGIESVSNANGYTLTQVGQETVLKLAPADATNPGVVTAIDQTFGGNKTFNGNVSVATGASLNVVDGATTLGGTLSVAKDVTVGSASVPANSILNGALSVNGQSTLAGAVTGASTPTSAIKIVNPVDVSASDVQSYLVVDADGNVKRGASSNASLAKYQIPVPLGTSAAFDPEGNSGVEFTLNINEIKVNDAIVVNFAAADRAKFAGLTILSATASADGTVKVNIADFRNPAVAGYTVPDIDSANLIVTKYNAANVVLAVTPRP
ncbi:hypothetical protein [uncultured Pedobacter sp.]|uniref:hypothetical protein n=1 Tax=uncultured Pedobacter sp. TaxID=246139 RepID=UPI0025D5FF3E|nr:hypothetical protein [uncultured Pedobacter sp.]